MTSGPGGGSAIAVKPGGEGDQTLKRLFYERKMRKHTIGSPLVKDGHVVANGGRVLNVTGLGPSAAAARERAYEAARKIEFNGKQMRSDIAERAVVGAEV